MIRFFDLAKTHVGESYGPAYERAKEILGF